MNARTKRDSRRLQIIIAALLILMTLQGLLGDSVNLFGAFPKSVGNSANGFASAVLSVGPILIVHVLNAFVILALGMAAIALAFRSGSRCSKIASIIGLFFVAAATAGGILFVMSGFANNPYSAMMGSSFIFAYAAYFIMLYCTKRQ